MNKGEEEEEESGMDASPCSSLHYSSCGESEFDRYCSANSALGTPSVCGSTGPFHDSLDSDFDSFTLGPTPKLSSSFGKTRLRDGERVVSSGETSTQNLNTDIIIQETDDLIGPKVCDDMNNQLSDVDEDSDDSLPDTGNHFNLHHKEEESKAENHNPFLITSSTAFGTNDWDEFELQATELNHTPFDFSCFQEPHQGMISTKLPDVVSQPGKGILTLVGAPDLGENIEDLTVLNQREQGGVATDSITVRGSGDLSVGIKTLLVPQSLVKEEFVPDRPVAMNYLQSCDADGVLDITPVELGNEDSSCGMIGDLDGNVSVGLLHESSENAKQSFGECTSEPLLASSNSDKPSSTDSHPVINSLQVNNTQPKKENTELNEFYDDFVHDMEDILLDSGESSGARYSKSDKMFQLHLSLPNRDGGQTATTSGLEDSSPTVSQRFRIDRVEVVGVKQKKGDVSLSERLVGVKEYTVYVIRVWSGRDKWEIERRYRDFYSLYRRLTSLFTDQGWTLPTPWASVERESRKIFGTSPNAVAERTVLIQDCLNSVLRSRFFPTLPNALLRFLSPQDASSSGSDSMMSPTGSAGVTFAATSSSYGNTISLIVDIRPHKTVKQLLEAQHYICAGCHRYFDDGATLVRDFVKALGWGKPRLCEYTGQLFCSSCHTNDMSVLPARVLHHWDFNPYPVSQLAKSYLDSIHEQPMLCVSAVNPFLSSKVPALNHIMSIRKRITIMLPYVHCPFRKTLNKGLSTRRHLLESTDFFALRDLIDLSKGPFAALPAIVETVRKKILEHITEQCLVCCDVGVPCNARQACDDTSSLIFPFQQEDEVKKCRSCGLVYHKRCFSRLSNCHCGTQLKPNKSSAELQVSEKKSDSTSVLPLRFLSGLFGKTKKDSETTILMGSLPTNDL
ncbi:uncharacterized protein LOC108843224 isoform X1 [Raphanus sativus]|uniref:Uncharacterized protein LOC108843224 isoform X1 n=1 Tax=Raphanus sativus TaxID=3726 RepID=A0A6J0MH96_RAPSA|nr:uncharacterized protein LOC108843224 isoform X1 [Raphanus sativus]